MVDRRSTLSLHSSRHVKLGYADIDVSTIPSTIPANYPLVPRRRISTRSIYPLLSFEIIIIISRSISLFANLIVRTINLALSLSRIVEKRRIHPSIYPSVIHFLAFFVFSNLETFDFLVTTPRVEVSPYLPFLSPLPTQLVGSFRYLVTNRILVTSKVNDPARSAR